MTIEQLKGALTARPFRPFIVHMADGRTLPVRHPDYCLLSPSGRTAFVFQTPDEFSIVDLLLMTEVDLAPSTAAS